MLDMLHSNMSVVCTYHCRGVFHEKYFLVWLLFFVDLCSQKVGKGTELQFLCTQGTLQDGRVEDHRLMFTRQLHSPQLYIQATLSIYKTDYMMSLTHYTLASVWTFSMLYNCTHFMCSLHLLVIIVEIVRKANRWTEDNEMRATVNFTLW